MEKCPEYNSTIAANGSKDVRLQFPYYFHLFGITLHPHPVMEVAAYAAGLATHYAIKKHQRTLQTPLQLQQSLMLIAGALLGALAGAKLLVWAEHWHSLTSGSPGTGLERWLGGKTIVGGLAGGWIGVEIAKKLSGIQQRTGDTWVYPLLLSIAIGRVGCFLTGLKDDTYGNPTNAPWAVAFEDGIPRHPTQLYEIAFLLLLLCALLLLQRITHLSFATGKLFRIFMCAYGSWRFFIEFLKPTDKPFLGLSPIQVASLLIALWSAGELLFRQSPAVPPEPAPSSAPIS